MKWKYLDSKQLFTGNAEIMILKLGGGGGGWSLPPPTATLWWRQKWNYVLPPSLIVGTTNTTAHWLCSLSAINSKRTLFKNPRHTSHANTSTVSVTAAFKTRVNQENKNLIYKNADKTSKLVPLQTQSFATHKTTFTSCLGLGRHTTLRSSKILRIFFQLTAKYHI